jgi:hypothetical protein
METVMMRIVLGLGCGVRDLDEKQSTELLMEISTGGGPDGSFLGCAHSGDGAFDDIATGNGAELGKKSGNAGKLAGAELGNEPGFALNRPIGLGNEVALHHQTIAILQGFVVHNVNDDALRGDGTEMDSLKSAAARRRPWA